MRTKFVKLLAAVLIGLASSVTVAAFTATPAAADACYTWDRVLKRGMSGSDVRQLQIRIAGWVSYREVLIIDGVFGPATENAVKRFQNGYGLAVDGIAGSQTYNKIYQLQDSDCTPVHFGYWEIDDGCGGSGFDGGKVSASRAKHNALRQLWKLEALRRKTGSNPIYISSGFRSIACNNAVGGSSNSQHLYGMSADLTGSPSLCTLAKAARYAGFSGIIGPGAAGHNDHVHLDSRYENNDDGISNGFYWSAPSCGI